MSRAKIVLAVFLYFAGSFLVQAEGGETVKLPGGGTLAIDPDHVNHVSYSRGGETLELYRSVARGKLLLTDGRRDLIADTLELQDRGRELLPEILAPTKATYWLQTPEEFWKTFIKSRFHDYAQQTTKVPATGLPVKRWLKEGDVVGWNELQFRVFETPGYTRSALTYLLEAEGKRVAFTGDLIYGDGQVLDLYSFQDAIASAQIRGYHGYGSRLAGLVESLDKLAGAKPDLIVPARGDVIRNPARAIQTLKDRVQRVYANYLSTNALHWYFKEKRMNQCGQRVLGKEAKVQLMPYCQHETTPDWVFENSTSRLLISESGHGFLLDCGYQRVIDAIQDLQKKEIVKDVEGLFVTHYHDDHTDQVQTAAKTFDCPVYATHEYADVLENPDAYHLPAMTANPITPIRRLASGHQMKWREFELTFFFFPGQTYYHGALLAKKPGADPILFVGDAFAPSGFDDYCVLNRNLLGQDQGMQRCLKIVRETPAWLVNEHIRHVFRFDAKELDYLQSRYRARIATQAELFDFDAANYGVDEQWAFFYPYAANVDRGAEHTVEFRVWNHSPTAHDFRVAPRAHNGAKLVDSKTKTIHLKPGAKGVVKFKVVAPSGPQPVALVTADVTAPDSQGRIRTLRQWAETMLILK
jgi:glyoxylase-like metal-dependent hydrolase (beta-lactamase superfamily II)